MFKAISNIFGQNKTVTPKYNYSKNYVYRQWNEHIVEIKTKATKEYEQIDEVKKDVFHQALGSQGYSSRRLQGNSIVSSIHSVLKDIQDMSAENKELSQIETLFEKAHELAVQFELTKRVKDENLIEPYQQKFLENVSESLASLEDGGKLLMPYGVHGHVVLMEVTAKVIDGKKTWNWKVYNAGLGSDIYHIQKGPLGRINPWAKTQTFEISGIDPSKIELKDFLKQLFFQNSERKKWYNPQRFISSITNFLGFSYPVYRHLKISLIRDAGGKFVKHKNKPTSYHKGQKAGICSRKCYTLWMRENLSEINYRRYKVKTAKTAQDRLHKLKDRHSIKKVEPKKDDLKASKQLKSAAFIKKHWYRLRKRDDTDTLLFFTKRALQHREEKLQALESQRAKFERLFSTFQ